MKKQLPAWAALGIITVAAGLLLGLTKELTEDRIAAAVAAEAEAARVLVLPGAETFEKQELPEGSTVNALFKGTASGSEVGYVGVITVKGYGGEIEVTVGTDNEARITGVSVGGSQFSETAGLGAKTKEAKFRDQFTGLTDQPVIGENIQAVTGATISSSAVTSGVTKCLGTIRALIYGEEESAADDEPLPGAQNLVENAGSGDIIKWWQADNGKVIQVAKKGFGGPITVNVGINNDGTIAGVVIDSENFSETAGVGERVLTEASFREQFKGKSGALAFGSGIDALTGATVSSTAVLDAVNEALAFASGGSVPAAETTADEPVPTPTPEPTPEPAPAVEAAETKKVTKQGFGGPVTLDIGLAADGSIASIAVDETGFAETPGLGERVLTEPEFLQQFVGKQGTLAYGSGIDALTGATVTSNAVLEAVNEALSGGAVPAMAEAGATGTAAVGGAKEASAKGFGGEIKVKLTLDASGAIETMEIVKDGFAETEGVGSRVLDDAFIQQFIGKSGTLAYGSGIDAVSGATISSGAVLEAVNAALNNYQAISTTRLAAMPGGSTRI